jgi:hypothetical protein
MPPCPGGYLMMLILTIKKTGKPLPVRRSLTRTVTS